MTTWASTRKHSPFIRKHLQSREKTLPQIIHDLATSYGNIGAVYDKNGRVLASTLLSSESTCNQRKTLPPNHPQFGYFLLQYR